MEQMTQETFCYRGKEHHVSVWGNENGGQFQEEYTSKYGQTIDILVQRVEA